MENPTESFFCKNNLPLLNDRVRELLKETLLKVYGSEFLELVRVPLLLLFAFYKDPRSSLHCHSLGFHLETADSCVDPGKSKRSRFRLSDSKTI